MPIEFATSTGIAFMRMQRRSEIWLKGFHEEVIFFVIGQYNTAWEGGEVGRRTDVYVNPARCNASQDCSMLLIAMESVA